MDLHGGNIYKISKKLGIPHSEIIDFSSNINPLGVPASIKEIIIDSLDNLKNYPDPNYEGLVSVISSHHNIDPAAVIPGNGATELIYLYCRIKKPERAIIVSPTFAEYHNALNQWGTKIDYIKLKKEDNFIFNIDEILKQLDDKYDLLVICNPNNPTGSIIEIPDIIKILNSAQNNKTSVMLDESFIQFANYPNNNSAVNIIKDFPNLFLLRSMTKIYGIPGLRLGYAVSYNEELNNTMLKNREPWTVNLLADLSARVIFDDTDYLQRTIELVEQERNFLIDRLNRMKWLKAYESSVNFILVEILNHLSAAEVREQLLEYNILIRDASNFHFLDQNYFRVAVKNHAENEKLINALLEVK